jgi:hypothetical protein
MRYLIVVPKAVLGRLIQAQDLGFDEGGNLTDNGNLY